MFDRFDYQSTLTNSVQAIMPKTLEAWGFVALAIIGLWFVCMVVVVVLEAAREYCSHARDETPTPNPRHPAS